MEEIKKFKWKLCQFGYFIFHLSNHQECEWVYFNSMILPINRLEDWVQTPIYRQTKELMENED